MQNWPRKDAADLLATVVRETAETEPYATMFGVGGGHYAPRFTEIALGYKVDFGHMLPNYQMEGKDDEEISRMLALAAEATGTKTAYLHRKSMKGAQAQKVRDLGEALGIEWMRSEDLEPLH